MIGYIILFVCVFNIVFLSSYTTCMKNKELNRERKKTEAYEQALLKALDKMEELSEKLK